MLRWQIVYFFLHLLTILNLFLFIFYFFIEYLKKSDGAEISGKPKLVQFYYFNSIGFKCVLD